MEDEPFDPIHSGLITVGAICAELMIELSKAGKLDMGGMESRIASVKNIVNATFKNQAAGSMADMILSNVRTEVQWKT